jgi:RNA 2',3'-cyclic 3'-phosphodiesterase
MAMTNAGLGRLVDTAYTPHVTLLRDDHLVDEHPISPIAWWVREFVLVHSLLGRTQYKILARFPLQ